MKKLTIIFFLTTIGFMFIACHVYAFSFYHHYTSADHCYTSSFPNPSLQFETNDLLEEITDSFGLSPSDGRPAVVPHVKSAYSGLLMYQHRNNHHNVQPLYIFNHVLLI